MENALASMVAFAHVFTLKLQSKILAKKRVKKHLWMNLENRAECFETEKLCSKLEKNSYFARSQRGEGPLKVSV